MKTKITSLISVLAGFGWLALSRLSRKPGFPEKAADILTRWGWVFWILLIFGVALYIRERLGKCLPEIRISGDTLWVEAGILLFTAASLSMLIRSGYYWDDAVNSTQYLAEKYNGKSVLENVLHFMSLYLKLGRINVLSFYYYFFFYIENVSVYKALIILLVLVDQVIFERTLLEMGMSRKSARIGMLMIPVLIQVRMYQDPVSGFYGLMQVLTAEMLLTVLFLLRFRKSGKRGHLILSLLFFGIGLLTYEVCFPFIAMVLLLNLVWELQTEKAFFRSLGRAIVKSLPYIILTAVLLAAVFLLRSSNVKQSTYSGVAFNIDPVRILKTAWYQFSAALPLSYYTAGHWQTVFGPSYAAAALMNYAPTKALRAVSGSDIVLLCLAFLLIAAIRKGDPDGQEKESAFPVRTGLCFWVLPILTVALSQRYQGQLYAGIGYLPVYMEYFGVAMLLTVLLQRAARKAPLITSTAAVSAFCVIFLLNIQNDRSVTDVINRYFYDPRNAGEAALKAGILDFLPDDAVLAVRNSGDYLWEANWMNSGLYREFYSIWSGKDIRKVCAYADLPEDASDVRLISYDGTPQYGLTRLGHRTDDGESADQITYFVSGKYPEHAVIRYTDSEGKPHRIAPDEGQTVRKTAYGTLYQLDPEEQILFDSLVIGF